MSPTLHLHYEGLIQGKIERKKEKRGERERKMKREAKRETHAATIDDNPRPRLPPLLPPPYGILGLRKWVLGTNHAFFPRPHLPLSTTHTANGETKKEEREKNRNN